MFYDKQFILFDLDGTVTESGRGIMNGIRYSMEKMGREELCRDENLLKRFIGPPLTWSYTHLFQLSEQDTEEAILHFRDYYSVQGSLYENRLYDGIIELFEALLTADKKLVLATSKPELTALSVIRYFDIEKYFYFLGTANLEMKRTEKTDVLQYILNHCKGITKENSVMVGDRVYDIEGAKTFGMASIGVSYGYANDGELEEAKPSCIVDSVSELRRMLIN